MTKSGAGSLRTLLLTEEESLLIAQCRFGFHKASGHGGQKVNKTSSAVRLVHEPTGLTAVSSESRSQMENRHIAYRKIRKLAALQLREPPDPETFSYTPEDIPSLSNPSRYLPFLAVLLDFVYAAEPVPGFSPSAVRRILRRDPEVWRWICERREKEYAPFFVQKTERMQKNFKTEGQNFASA